MIAVVHADHHAAAASRWRETLESIVPVVFWNQAGRGSVLVNAITDDWLRCDLIIVTPDAFGRRSRDRLRPLFDRDGLYESLPETLTPSQPDPARVARLIGEFIRVLGLAGVVVGRGEYFTAVYGAGLQREALMNLMLEEVTVPDPGGALHLSAVLPPDRMAVLLALPCPKPDRDEVIAAHIEIARQFFPRARVLSATLGIDWPEAFETAARRTLQRQFGNEYDFDWD